MGEIAEDLIDGTSCSLCGEYFEDPKNGQTYTHGYPVACHDCYEKGCGYQKALVSTF